MQWKNWIKQLNSKERVDHMNQHQARRSRNHYSSPNYWKTEISNFIHQIMCHSSKKKKVRSSNHVPYISAELFLSRFPQKLNRENNATPNHYKITLLDIQIQICSKYGNRNSS